MAHKDKGDTVRLFAAHSARALLLEEEVTDAEGLIDNQKPGFEVQIERERQADEHARRVGLDGLVEVLADIGKLSDSFDLCSDCGVRIAEERAKKNRFHGR
jgi:hypothetical protein